MIAKLFVIRPEPGFSATLAAGQDRGFDMVGAPLFEVEPLEGEAPDPARYDGVLLGSANAIRHGGTELTAWRGRPAYVVGSTTAAAARDAGLEVAQIGCGGLQRLLDELPDRPLHLLRLAGADHVSLTPPDHIELTTRVVYRSRALPMPHSMAEQLADGGTVLLHSARAAQHFAAECGRLGIETFRIGLISLGPRIGDTARAAARWAFVHDADRAEDAALLALAGRMCQ